MIFLVGGGPLLLPATGLRFWSLTGVISSFVSGYAGVTILWLGLGVSVWRRGCTCDLPPWLRQTLAVSALVVVAVTAKSTYSGGPAGELYRGTISRNLTIGDRMDSRFPFFTSQAAARNLGPGAPETERYFQPWTFFSRGPLAGLATLPIVFATGGRPPVARAGQPWHPFDPQGFAAYRVAMMTLASGIIVAMGALLALFVPPAWALAGAGLLAGQGGFLRYWLLADREIATWATWRHTRWMNFANTFVPLHVYLSDYSFRHIRADSVYEPSGRLLKFAYVWWNTLPFGLGLGLWAAFLFAFARAWRWLRAAAVLWVVGPALLITANWGWDPLGLMRECGHPLFVAALALTCVIAAHRADALNRVLTHRAVPWLQLPETLLMLWLTTLLNPQPLPVDFNQLDPLCLAINALALVAAAWVLCRARTAPAAPG